MTDPLDLSNPDRPLVADRYKVLKQLGKGSFCTAYLCQHVRKSAAEGTFCLKVEKTTNKSFKQLNFEAKLYKLLCREEGFPQIRHFGTAPTFNFLAMELLGPTIEDLYVSNGNKFSMKCICLIAGQILHRLESLHRYGFLHRDLKPENFLIGRHSKASVIYMCDLGLCKKYRDSETGEHIPYQTNKSLAGTARYASVNALSGNEQSRRDDMESMGYLLLYLATSSLPWQGLKGETRPIKYEKIRDCKKKTPVDVMCQGLPPEFKKFMLYVKNMQFTEDPNYSSLRSFFEHRLNILNAEHPEQPSRLDWLVNPPEKYRDIIAFNC